MKKVWGFFWFLAAGLGGYALWTAWQLPSESRNAVWMGMSQNKLLLCGAMALMILLCIAGAFISLINKNDTIFSTGKAAGAAGYLIIFALVLGKIMLTPPIGNTALARSLLKRLQPLAYWGFGFTILTVLLLFIQKFKKIWTYQTASIPALIWGIFFFLAMAGIIYYALQSGIGLDPISGTFYRQGVSLLEGQLILPLLFLYPLLPLFTLFSPGKRGEKLLCFLGGAVLWIAAIYFWQTTAFEGHSYFAPALRLPNNNYYPASDAENYDLIAQSIMLGNGFRNGLTIVRPLYTVFLALLHWIFGNDYMRLTNGQIVVLALIPVIVFLIGKQLRHSGAGLIAAVWVIWREIYSIRITSLVQVSNSRLLMSDLPTMLLTASVVLSTVIWYRTERRSVHALISGGLIGMAMLLRTQSFVLIPAVWLIFICSGKKFSDIFRGLIFSCLGVILVFGPWTFWMYEHPNTTENAENSENQYLLALYRNALDEKDQEKGLFEMINSHPAETFRTVTAHFINNEISSLLVLPVREELPTDADRLFYEEDLFWYRENARETIEKNQALILINLIVISFGVVSAYRKAGFAGLAPMIIHLVYNLGNAFALTSGFRFILPVDWGFVFYFALGCAALFQFIGNILLFSPSVSLSYETYALDEPVYGKGLTFAFCCVLLILIGLVLPFSDSMIPKRFSSKTQDQLASEWKVSSENAANILSGVREKDLVFLEGRAFYPRYYAAGEGDSGGSSSVKRGGENDRLVWMFMDNTVHVLSCDLSSDLAMEMINHPYPDPMDVTVVGIQQEDYIEVLEMRALASTAGK